MRFLRSSILAIGLLGLSVGACGGKDKGAEEPAANPCANPCGGGENPCAPAEGGETPAEGGEANPCGGGEANPCGGGEENPCGGGCPAAKVYDVRSPAIPPDREYTTSTAWCSPAGAVSDSLVSGALGSGAVDEVSFVPEASGSSVSSPQPASPSTPASAATVSAVRHMVIAV